MLELAIDSTIRQVSKCFYDGLDRKIRILGSRVEKVAKALKDTWEIKAKGKHVLCVSVSRHHSTKDVRQSIVEQIRGYKEADKIFNNPNILRCYLPRDFFLLVDCTDDGQIDLHDLGIPNCGFVLVLTTRSQKVYEIMNLDLEIRMEDHMLPWELLCTNVGPSLVHTSSIIQQMAIHLVKECHGNLLAIILLARALKGMPLLRVLELSSTSIKSLPPSISRLRSLQKFNLRGCALLMELPPQLGVLGNLEIFDLERTGIMYLPEEIGELISLTCFKVSFCGRTNYYMDLIIPTKALSKLSELEELSIDVNPDDECWDVEVKTLLNELTKALKLKFLELYLSTVEILQLLR
ncbi:Disease resistance protein [Camellia lanceoleosa]|uniref:Disease resistance protein n=1 Tax=Camellia lanceoleosa TaxID=1840588 RepID=A0ACC0IKU9_9ERIC|nr:Disease resistance protein [Camellia lanceoleosa]